MILSKGNQNVESVGYIWSYNEVFLEGLDIRFFFENEINEVYLFELDQLV